MDKKVFDDIALKSAVCNSEGQNLDWQRNNAPFGINFKL